jgi:hypothetical protein
MMLDDFQWERMINHLFFLLNFSGKAIYPKKTEHNEHKHKWDIKLLFSVDFPSIWVLG